MIVTEYMENGSLDTFLRVRSKFVFSFTAHPLGLVPAPQPHSHCVRESCGCWAVTFPADTGSRHCVWLAGVPLQKQGQQPEHLSEALRGQEVGRGTSRRHWGQRRYKAKDKRHWGTGLMTAAPTGWW